MALKRKRSKIILAIILSAALSLFGWIWLGRSNQLAVVEVMKAEPGEITVKIPANGTLEEIEKEAIYYEGTGKVESVEVELGDWVEPGNLLARIETADMSNKIGAVLLQLEIEELNLGKLEKSRQDALAQLELALRDAGKLAAGNEALYEAGALALAELEKSQEALAELEKQYDEYLQLKDLFYYDMAQIQKQMEITRLNLADLERDQEKYSGEITSPRAGVVTAVNVKKGELLSGALPAFVISQIDPLEINIYVNEYDIAKVAVGQPVEIETDALAGRVFEGVVERIAPVATKMSTGQSMDTVVQITIQVMDPDPMLKPGFTVKTQIISEKKEEALVVPFDSIQTADDGSKVIYVVENGQAALRKVETGIESDFDVEVLSGIESGDLVILRPGQSIREGLPVSIASMP